MIDRAASKHSKYRQMSPAFLYASESFYLPEQDETPRLVQPEDAMSNN